ncbi:putative disease resistance protein RGA3 [Gossypium hirsutum]|uniref:Disease resistance protein RGA3 n=1 Tax=Gossypium hirsutum TaxID=3635 RepID=A0A1U8M1D7_GOSHI|nr:putative disease resistance protein RGA3 [Gossypium hirsutum]
MAETFLFNIAERVLEKLVHLSVQEIRLALIVKTELKRSEDTMSSIKAKTDESDWIYIRESEIWRLEQHENDILPVMKLSYNHLPSHLQRCLAFLSLYKKDEIYVSDRVICLWMANGLLEHPKQNQEWEDVGKRYLNELLSRCLIQMEQDFWLYFTFKMHDLVHDLALDVSQKECKTVNSETETVDENVRHLLFCDEKLVGVPRVLEEMKNVRIRD